MKTALKVAAVALLSVVGITLVAVAGVVVWWVTSNCGGHNVVC